MDNKRTRSDNTQTTSVRKEYSDYKMNIPKSAYRSKQTNNSDKEILEMLKEMGF